MTRKWKQPRCPLTEEWIRNIYTYIYIMKYYSVIKKNEIMPFAAIQMEMIIQSEVSQTEKDKYHVILLIWKI